MKLTFAGSPVNKPLFWTRVQWPRFVRPWRIRRVGRVLLKCTKDENGWGDFWEQSPPKVSRPTRRGTAKAPKAPKAPKAASKPARETRRSTEEEKGVALLDSGWEDGEIDIDISAMKRDCETFIFWDLDGLMPESWNLEEEVPQLKSAVSEVGRVAGIRCYAHRLEDKQVRQARLTSRELGSRPVRRRNEPEITDLEKMSPQEFQAMTLKILARYNPYYWFWSDMAWDNGPPDKSKAYRCILCETRFFKNVGTLRRHFRDVHGRNIERQLSRTKDNIDRINWESSSWIQRYKTMREALGLVEPEMDVFEVQSALTELGIEVRGLRSPRKKGLRRMFVDMAKWSEQTANSQNRKRKRSLCVVTNDLDFTSIFNELHCQNPDLLITVVRQEGDALGFPGADLIINYEDALRGVFTARTNPEGMADEYEELTDTPETSKPSRARKARIAELNSVPTKDSS